LILVDAGYPDRTEPVVNYFEDNFTGRPVRRGNCRNAVFPTILRCKPACCWIAASHQQQCWRLALWNGFQSSLHCAHPTVWKLLEQLRRENELKKLTVVQWLAGQEYNVQTKTFLPNYLRNVVNVVA